MSQRRNPVLLRETPLTKSVVVLTNYTVSDGFETARADGKHDVTNDFTRIMLDRLLGRDVKTQPIVRKAAAGLALSDDERAVLDRLADRLEVAIGSVRS